MTRTRILILSADALGAALLGGALDFAGCEPEFPRAGEPARAALRRTRPATVLIDPGHSEACAEGFIGPALMTGARVMLLSSAREDRVIPAEVARLALPTLELPRDAGRLPELLGGRAPVRRAGGEDA